jgi:ABC-type Fe3+-hydroxamate transport system substrate-binding protein
LEEGELEIGQVASMLNEEKSVEEIFESFRQGFAKAKERLQQM